MKDGFKHMLDLMGRKLEQRTGPRDPENGFDVGFGEERFLPSYMIDCPRDYRRPERKKYKENSFEEL